MAGRQIRWGWTIAAVASGLFGLLLLEFYVRNFHRPMLLDFMSFWAAGRLALGGTPAAAFDLIAVQKVQQTVLGPSPATMPFPYPPAFLLVVAPLAALPYFPALVLWVIGTGALYLRAARRWAAVPVAAAQPAGLINAMIGQNGFLLSGLFLWGVSRLERRPMVAGLTLGLLIVKPQIAFLLPVAVIAVRAWPAIAGAVASGGALVLGSLLVFGWQSYAAFFAQLPQYAKWMKADRFSWEEFASPFGLMRSLGAGSSAALVVQAAAAGAAVWLCWRAWREKWDDRVPVLCAGTLLMSPYLQSYDTLLMVAPIAWWLERKPAIAAILWVLCFMILARHLEWWSGPDITAVAALASLGFSWWERRLADSVSKRPAIRAGLPLGSAKRA